MRKDHDDIRSGRPGGPDVGPAVGQVERRGTGPARGRSGRTEVDRVVGEDRHPDRAHGEPGRPAGRRHVGARADRDDAGRPHGTDRLDDAVRAGVADVVVRQRHDVHAGVGDAGLETGIEGEREPVQARVVREGVRARTLVIDDGQVGVLEQRPDRAGVAGPGRLDDRLAGAAAGPPDDAGGSAIPWEVGAVPQEHRPPVHLAVVHDVAGGDERPGRAEVERGHCAASGRRRDGERPLPERADAGVAKQRPAAHGERAHGRLDIARAYEAEDVAMAPDRGDRCRGRERAHLRPGADTERGFERGKVRPADHDQPEPEIAAAEGRPDLLERQRPDRRPEPDDRDDGQPGHGCPAGIPDGPAGRSTGALLGREWPGARCTGGAGVRLGTPGQRGGSGG